MLHTKSQGHWPSGSEVEDLKRVFTIYGSGGHLGHVTRTILKTFVPSTYERGTCIKRLFRPPRRSKKVSSY